FLRTPFGEALRELLGGERRLLALTAELLHRHVPGRPELDLLDHAGRAALFPHPDVLHLHLRERVRWLGQVLEGELVAEIGAVLGEHAVAEQRIDRAVLPLQPQLELGLEFVELVDMAHGRDCSPRNNSMTTPIPGTTRAGASSESGSSTNARSARRGC